MADSHMDRKGLMDLLKELDIETITVEHPEVFTVEEMMPHCAHLEGAVSKNLFLKDKKKKLWLFSAKHDLDVKLSDLAKKVSAPGGLRLADESILVDKLGVRQGCVTAFALVNDKDKHDVKFIVDEDLVNGTYDKIYFHPLSNAATTGISPQDFLKFLGHTGHEPIKVNLREPE